MWTDRHEENNKRIFVTFHSERAESKLKLTAIKNGFLYNLYKQQEQKHWSSHNKLIISLSCINQVIFLMVTRLVFFGVK